MPKFPQILLIFCFFCASAFAEDKFGFSTETFQLGQWSPKTLTYEQGLKKIQLIDNWFYSLSMDERKKAFDSFAINRNRLFIVTQEKRLESELNAHERSAADTDAGVKAIQKEKTAQLTAVRALSKNLINDSTALKKNVFGQIKDIQLAIPENSKLEGSFVGSSGVFGQSLSKTGASQGMFGPRNDSDHFRLRDLDCGTDSKCLRQKKQFETVIKKFRIFLSNDRIALNPNEAAIQAPICKSKDLPAGSLKDAAKNPKLSQFLKDSGVSQTESAQKANDLSNLFGPPHTQWVDGHPTAMCVGFAIASNVMATLYKDNFIKIHAINAPKDISPEQTYAAANKFQQTAPLPDQNSKTYCDPNTYNVSPFDGIQSVTQSIALFEKVPLCSKSTGKDNPELYKVDKFSAVEFAEADVKPNFAIIKAMIDSGHPPIVGVDSDARTESAGWINIKSGGAYTHVLNVVGYNEGIDPVTLCPTKYFIVRDSMGKQEVHYKITAENLLGHLDGIYQISKVHRTIESARPRDQQSHEGVK